MEVIKMKVRLAYPDKLVIVEGGRVVVFSGKLVEGELEEVLSYAESGQGVIPDELREVASDIKRAVDIMRMQIGIRGREVEMPVY
ncbi:hypothetical protein P8X24_01410 [Pyrococcus kukulkanii]|uniref:hypothetical protein n=1 Tax=Pyrococcus kukulkanii TaxID=1609559 RepID=UPI00356A7445